ncbi:sensor histidine kinase [Cytophagaceae bacterium YF14B1]|uniref:histidine kinase n=1 Tax=Xanthocytophaga flava TaxID=3048013 RepID=A0AAE3QVE4_9BACT|nr:sensor histidine kinase [Xanthocytophaga flavus]MDJ1485721.1 sensor histidine kinase [Xanthocytophaga flavus]
MRRIVLLIGISCGIFLYCLAIAQTPYPDPEKNYNQEELIRWLRDFQQQKDTLGIAFCYLAYAKNQEKWNDPEESPVYSYNNSMEMFRLKGDSSNYYEAMGGLGIYFMDRPLFRQFAKEYITQSVAYFKRSNIPQKEIGHLINLANVHVREGLIPEATQMLQRADQLNNKLRIPLFQGRTDAAWADLYGHIFNNAKALAYADKSLQIARQAHIEWLEALSLYYKGRSYKDMGQFTEAIPTLMESLKITESNITLLQLRREVYRSLGYAYMDLKDYEKSTQYMLRMQETADYAYNSKIERDINSFKDYLLIGRQKEQLAKAALEKKLTQSELDRLQSRQQFYIIIVVLAVCLTGASIYIAANQVHLNQLRDEKVKKNLQIETLSALIQGQESERSRISQELHDGVGTLLSRIKMCIEHPNMSREKVVQMIDDACGEVRSISGNLQPNTLEKFGLIRAVEDLIIKQKEESPQIIFQHFGNPTPITPDKNLMIYRIVQELLTNALKHAEASEILLEIVYQKEDILCLTIEDDGVGFDEKTVSPERSGWRNIRSRIEYLQGMLWLNSAPAVGTSVTIHIPLA